MGQTASDFAKKVKQTWSASSDNDYAYSTADKVTDNQVTTALAKWKDPFVYTKTV